MKDDVLYLRCKHCDSAVSIKETLNEDMFKVAKKHDVISFRCPMCDIVDTSSVFELAHGGIVKRKPQARG